MTSDAYIGKWANCIYPVAGIFFPILALNFTILFLVLVKYWAISRGLEKDFTMAISRNNGLNYADYDQ